MNVSFDHSINEGKREKPMAESCNLWMFHLSVQLPKKNLRNTWIISCKKETTKKEFSLGILEIPFHLINRSSEFQTVLSFHTKTSIFSRAVTKTPEFMFVLETWYFLNTIILFSIDSWCVTSLRKFSSWYGSPLSDNSLK